MQPFSDAEIEFFIETNGRLSADRALALGTEFVRFIEAQFNESELEAIEIVHLGRGSFRSRLMIILRDPATGTLAALAALALGGASLLENNSDDSFALEVAEACIESGAARCGFRTSQEVFVVERNAMPAISKLQASKSEGAEPFSKEFSSDFGNVSPKSAKEFQRSDNGSTQSYEHEPPEVDVVGVFDRDNGAPKVFTVDGSFNIELEDHLKPPENRVANFRLRGPLKKHGRTYTMEGWVLQSDSPVETFVGRMIEVHDGHAVTFETTDGARYGPLVPDDTLGWVPMGALVEVKAWLNDDEQLEIYDWRELEREEVDKSSWTGLSPELSTYGGMLSEDGLEFAADWGGTALVDGVVDGLNVPRNKPIEIRAELRRGSRGGIADPRLFIHSWRPLGDSTVSVQD